MTPFADSVMPSTHFSVRTMRHILRSSDWLWQKHSSLGMAQNFRNVPSGLPKPLFRCTNGLRQSIPQQLSTAKCRFRLYGRAIASPAQWLAVGNGWSVYESRFAPDLATLCRAPLLFPHATDVAHLGAALHGRGESVDVAHALPLYLRGAVD